jgi:hypothetical protein
MSVFAYSFIYRFDDRAILTPILHLVLLATFPMQFLFFMSCPIFNFIQKKLSYFEIVLLAFHFTDALPVFSLARHFSSPSTTSAHLVISAP